MDCIPESLGGRRQAISLFESRNNDVDVSLGLKILQHQGNQRIINCSIVQCFSTLEKIRSVFSDVVNSCGMRSKVFLQFIELVTTSCDKTDVIFILVLLDNY